MQQRLFSLRRLKRFGMASQILKNFYRCIIESTALGPKALQRVVQMVKYITGGELPATQDIYTRRGLRKIAKDLCHPSHGLLSPPLSGKRYRSIRSQTNRLWDSFYFQAIGLWTAHQELTTYTYLYWLYLHWLYTHYPHIHKHIYWYSRTPLHTHTRLHYTNATSIPFIDWYWYWPCI